ncbi:MAG: YkgJ family cysteine cluster protein [Candidatus Aenigmarchaeota archaeon]|nr:YkgJ family cysteine cluster protein [Candidatus Aenigmarchaeota archaeon]
MNYGCDNCTNCGACCTGLDIELSKEDIRSLVSLGYKLEDFLETEPVPMLKTSPGKRRCIFLDNKNFCAIHGRHGHAAKPHTCRHYPKMTQEALSQRDYRFFKYGGKTLSRDVLANILASMKDVHESELFKSLLFRLEKLRKQKASYIDTFNYDDNRRHSELRKTFARRRAIKLAKAKVRSDDIAEFAAITKRRSFDSSGFTGELRARLMKGEGHNHNLPEMLLAYLYAIKKAEPRDAKAAAKYFFEWNAKRF